MKTLSPKLILSLLLIGAAAGLTGIVLTLLLHMVQHLAFGYPLNAELSYRVMVEESPPMRRLMVLLLCGGLVGVGWVMLHRLASPLVSIKTAVANGQRMPLAATLIHALLQIVTVGLGSPLGREVAPREISTALAERWAASRGLDEEERKILLACASGAGLAAVYNVPLAAAVFALETLLLSWSRERLLAALLACGTAVLVVRAALGDVIQYPLPDFPLPDGWFDAWALAAAPLLALGVWVFERNAERLPEIPRRKPAMVWVALLSFAFIGLLAWYFPEIMGNGKAGNQLSFQAALGVECPAAGGRHGCGGICGGNGVFGCGAENADYRAGVYVGVVAPVARVVATAVFVPGRNPAGVSGVAGEAGGLRAGRFQARCGNCLLHVADLPLRRAWQKGYLKFSGILLWFAGLAVI